MPDIKHLQLAKELTGSCDLDTLITEAKKIEDYLNTSNTVSSENRKLTLAEINTFVACRDDFKVFARYCKVQHAVRGPVSFLVDGHSDLLDEFSNIVMNNRRSIFCKARQIGFTTISAMFLLWKAMFHHDETILLVAYRYVNALEIMERIRFTYEALPTFLKAKPTDWNKGNLSFDNGSRIVARAASVDMARGLNISFLYLDEAAYISYSKDKEIWNAVAPCLSLGAGIIIASTPNHKKGLFWEIWSKGEGWGKATFMWKVVKDRDEEWAKFHKESLGQEKFNQEFECMFIEPPPDKDEDFKL